MILALKFLGDDIPVDMDRFPPQKNYQ